MNRGVELLAPAGCEENFYGAVNYGADAVYLGLSAFSARKNAGNFTLERLPYIVAYAHMFDVKVYVAVNTVIKNSELNRYFEHIELAWESGVDAFIVQDLFLGRKLKEKFPGIILHLSTQAGVNNLDGAKQAVSYGFSRVILARETPIEEIKKITKIVETEVFVQGALCTCFSGHCYFSSFIGGMSGNRGACRQPCRKLYKYEGKGIQDNMRYALSLSDLSLSSKVNELISAGVKSFKIEGRMRSFEYVCAACDLFDDLLNGKDLSRIKFENLKRTYNRGGYTEGMAFGQKKDFISDKIQNHAGSVVGIVSAIKGNELTVSALKHKISVGDCFKILTDGKETGHAMAIDKSGRISIVFKEKAFVGSELSITKDLNLIEKYKNKRKLHRVEVCVTAKANEPLSLNLNGRTYVSEYVVTEALTSAVTKSEIKENLRKKDIYPYEVIPSCLLEGKLFIPKKVMNELRSRAFEDYFYSFCNSRIKEDKNADNFLNYGDNYVCNNGESNGVTIISNDFSFLAFSTLKNVVFCPQDYNDKSEFQRFFTQIKDFGAVVKYLYVPAFLTADDERIIASALSDFDGLYCESASGLFLAKRYKKKFFGGIELNVVNNLTYDLLKAEGAEEISLSKELSYKEIYSMQVGYVLSFGDVKIMSLVYCPFSKTCNICKVKGQFALKDSNGRTFKVRRYKLSSCRFEVYNEKMIRSKYSFEKQIFDFTTLSRNEINSLLKIYLNDQSNGEFTFTSGNLLRGVE